MDLSNICAESIRHKLFTVSAEWSKKTSVITVAEALDLFMTSMVSEGKTAKTIKWYGCVSFELRQIQEAKGS